MERKQALQAWAKQVLNDSDCTIKPASSDASFRSYWRVYSHTKTFIIMDAPPAHEDCLPFIDISKKLVNIGISAPKILHKNMTDGFLLLTDLGSQQYLAVLNSKNHISLYEDAINTIHHMQQKASIDHLPQYNAELLQQELNLFGQWFIIKHLDINLNDEQIYILEQIEKLLITNALQQPQAFVHRDYHSRNLMFLNKNNPGVLDFQDAVIGPVTYDLVSLLRDCYISWDDQEINELCNQFRIKYNALNNTKIESYQWQKWFDLMGVQRHLKAIGIFCRLNYRDNKPNYLKDLNRTLCYVKNISQLYPELKSFHNLIRDIFPSLDSLCKQ